uniref:Fatty acid synthase n=1 Tax=Meloidogyne incognita TaxID=6306 RepID=A0A914MEY8_MELIC
MTPPTLIQQNLNNSKSLTSSPSTASLKSRLSPHLEDDTLVAMFRRICSDESKRDKIVLKHNDRQWTLAQLDEITDRLSQLFVTQFSCKKGDCIAIYMHKCAEYVFAYIAALKAGAAYLPLDITYPDSLLKSVLDEVKPAGIKCPHRGAVISYKWRFLNYPYSDDDIEACNVFFVWEMFRPILQGITLVIIPDSVIYDPHSLCNFLAKNQITRMLFTPSLLEMVLDTQDEETLSRAFQCIRIVILCGEVVTCALLERFIRHFPHVRCINLYSISECHDVAVADLNEFYNNKNERRQFAPVGKVIEGVKILILDEKTMKRVPIGVPGEIYVAGPTLAIGYINRPEINAERFVPLPEEYQKEMGSQRMYRYKWRFLNYPYSDDDIEACNVFFVWEMFRPILQATTLVIIPDSVIYDPHSLCNFLAKNQITRMLFTPSLLEMVLDTQDEETLTRAFQCIRTGDWGYLLPNLVLEICGRCDTTVRIRGYSVELQAIEAALLNLNHVRSCTVISIGNEGEDKQLAAYIVLRDKQITRKQLRAQLKRVLPFYMMPQYFIFMEKLPLLAASSKIDKKALPSVNFARDVVEIDALPQTENEKELARIWIEILHLGSNGHLDIQESFFDMGGHSLLAARLLNAVNTRFGSHLGMRELFTAPTVYAMAKLLDGSQTIERSSPEQIIDLEQQIEANDLKGDIMDLHLRAFWRATTEWKKRFHAATVFLTGVTGFLGSHLLAQLLSSSKTKITCLIRESSNNINETVEERLLSTMKRNGLFNENIGEENFREQVRVVSGDIALVQFGLSDEDYHFLSYDIDVVLHAAAYVNLIYPYQALHGCNVVGTRNIIEFCFKNKIKSLHYISTDAVFPSGLIDVDEDTPPTDTFEKLVDGYGQTKYVAEQLVLRANYRGLPTIIYRLGNQAAPINGSNWNPQDFTYLLLLSTLKMNIAPNLGEWEVELTPVDFSAQFIVRILSEMFCENTGRIFHLINSGEGIVKWKQIIEWLKIIGFEEIKEIEIDEWIKMINESSSEEVCIQQLQKLVQGGLFQNNGIINLTQSKFLRTKTNKLLDDLNWKYPTICETIIREWIEQLIKSHIIERPKTTKNNCNG